MEAELILVNGKIFTQSEQSKFVEALAISNGKVIAIGSTAEVSSLRVKQGRAIDLDGAVVIPGLVDSHVHLMNYGTFLQSVNLNGATSAEEAVNRILLKTKNSASEWILGFGWNQTRWPGGDFPTKEDLDSFFTDRPVYMVAHSGHAAWVNSAAMSLAGINKGVLDPAGARIARDCKGEPTGVLFEDGAMELVRRMIPEPTDAECKERVRQAMERASQAGLTGVHDVDGIRAFRALQSLGDDSRLPLRVLKHLPQEHLEAYCEAGLMSGFGNEFLKIGGIKFFADGALGPRTAWMLDPYEGEMNIGIPTMPPADMEERVIKASRSGFYSVIHAIGDRANRSVLKILEKVREDEAARGINKARMPHRIEHAQLVDQSDMEKFVRLAITASMQPTHIISDMEMADRYWGERATYAYNWRGMLEKNIPLIFGSDAPIEAIEPLPGLQAAVTRRRQDGCPGPGGWHGDGNACLTLEEALAAFTLTPSVAARTGKNLGRLVPGYHADLTILSRDIFECAPSEIARAEVLGTMVDGVFTYSMLG